MTPAFFHVLSHSNITYWHQPYLLVALLVETALDFKLEKCFLILALLYCCVYNLRQLPWPNKLSTLHFIHQ